MQILFSVEEFPIGKMEEILKRKKCFNCKESIEEKDGDIYVFMSFSVPEKTWISLSEELIRYKKGIFVLRGLPNNSFKELSIKLMDLKKKGVKAEVRIDPNLFEKYKISYVPTFIKLKEKDFDKVSGNVSLKGTLELMSIN